MKEQIIELMKSFFSEMNKWERECGAISDASETEDLDMDKEYRILCEKKRSIFAKYCTTKNVQAVSEYNMSWGRKGDYKYDNERMSVVELKENKDRITVITQRQKPMPEEHRFILLNEDEQWRLDSKKRRMIGDKTWKTDYL